jgi:hypothetical protein
MRVIRGILLGMSIPGHRHRTLLIALCGALVAVCGASVAADDAAATNPEQPAFARDVVPFLSRYCTDCHGGAEPEAKLGLDMYQTSGRIQTDYEKWEKVLRMLQDRQMPPADVDQPAGEELLAALEAIRAEMDTFDCSQVEPFRRVTIRRLNRSEYNNTIRDLVGVDFQPAEDFPADDVGYGFDNIGDVLSIPPVLMEEYLDAAETIMQRALEDETLRAQLLVHQPSDDVDRRDAFRRNLSDFAKRAFRRPASERELERLFELTSDLFRSGAELEDITRSVFAAVLVSPQFLFRIENFDEDADSPQPLSDWELAARLSYFLWSSMPDEELFELAEAGRLHQPEVLSEQVRRMLADPKSRALVDNFAGQWLQLRDLDRLSPDPEMFSNFDESLRQAMRRETELFFEAIIREDRSIIDFLSADFTFLNERLARHYSLDGIAGEEFRRVDLPQGRRGVLTQASILLITSNPTRTSPVKRGKWILENILAEPPPPAPPDVPELQDEGELLGSLRERMEQHRANPACAVCHQTMDVLGFGLENFDAVGAWRDRDGRFAIDASGTLPGGAEFQGAAELMDVLIAQKREAFYRCVTEKMLTYALGRGLDAADRCTVKGIAESLLEQDDRFSVLVRAIVLSDQFRMQGITGDKR